MKTLPFNSPPAVWMVRWHRLSACLNNTRSVTNTCAGEHTNLPTVVYWHSEHRPLSMHRAPQWNKFVLFRARALTSPVWCSCVAFWSVHKWMTATVFTVNRNLRRIGDENPYLFQKQVPFKRDGLMPQCEKLSKSLETQTASSGAESLQASQFGQFHSSLSFIEAQCKKGLPRKAVLTTLSSRLEPTNNLHEMNDSCKLPRQHGSLGSFNSRRCANSAKDQ